MGTSKCPVELVTPSSVTTMTPAILTLAASLAVVSGQSFGPVDLEAVDPLSLSWNQIHWLVKDQIKEVEELKAEHDEIYNEIAGCYGLEKCLSEFDLVDIQPGTKLWNLGLRRVDLSMSDLTRQRDELEQMRVGLSNQMKQRQLELVRQEELRIQELHRQKEEIRRQEVLEKQKLEAARAALAASSSSSSSSSRSSSSSSSSSSSGWSESSSSYSRSSSSSAQGQPFFGQTGGSSTNFFSNQSTIYGPKPEVFDRGYKYTYSANSRSSSSRSRGYNG